MAVRCPKCRSENAETAKFCGNCATQLTPGGQTPDSLTKTLEIPVQTASKGTIVAGKYRILEEIGRGGMGIVYKAEDMKLERTVALKFLPPQLTLDPEARERFVHEARAASALDHPNICTVYEIGETDDGRMFIAMGCYEGESLRERIMRGPIEKGEAIAIALQVAQGLAKAHDKGIIHRDIKPANVLMTDDGIAKIVDFGLAMLAGQVRMTKEGMLIGTVAYMSPEQARGEAVERRTDIWSLGVVLYEMLTGRLPFKGDYDQSLIHSILTTEPEPMGKIDKGLPQGLKAIVFKALAKKPDARYPTMNQMLEDLEAVAEGLKPLRAKLGLFRGGVFGIRKSYAYAGLGVLAAAIALTLALNPGGLRDRALGKTRAGQITSLAVLPVKNYSGDPEQEYLADGITDELIASLGQIKALNKVISRTSVMQYKDAKKSLPQIAKELGVDRVVEASVMRSGGRVSITARLIDATKDRQLWTSRYEREGTDVLMLESELVQAIAGEIRVQVTPRESVRLKAARPVDAAAYDAFLRGRYFFSKWTMDGFGKAITYFEQAIRIEPTFAEAYVGLADAYGFAGSFGLLQPGEASQRVREAVRKALELDDNLAEAHAAMAGILWGDWNWADAERECRRAIALNPNSSYAHFVYCNYLTQMGRGDEAVREAQRALELDPLTTTMNLQLGFVLYYAGRYDESIAQIKKVLELDPYFWQANSELGWNYAQKKMYPEAMAECRRALALAPDDLNLLSTSGHVFGLAGERAEALKCLESLKNQSARQNVDHPMFLAYLYDGLGEVDQSLECLERAYRARSGGLSFLKVETYTNRLRSDPRFQDLLRRLDFPK